MSEIYQIQYMSVAVQPLSHVEIMRLVVKSQMANFNAGITGTLVYNGGSFFQIIEGAQADIENLYAKILKDPRHTRIIKIGECVIERRNYDRWTLAYLGGDGISLLK